MGLASPAESWGAYCAVISGSLGRTGAAAEQAGREGRRVARQLPAPNTVSYIRQTLLPLPVLWRPSLCLPLSPWPAIQGSPETGSQVPSRLICCLLPTLTPTPTSQVCSCHLQLVLRLDLCWTTAEGPGPCWGRTAVLPPRLSTNVLPVFFKVTVNKMAVRAMTKSS